MSPHRSREQAYFIVPVEQDRYYIADLKDEVKEEKSNVLKDVDADELIVWHCKESRERRRKPTRRAH